MKAVGKILLIGLGTAAVYGVAYGRKQARLINNSCYKPQIPKKVSIKKDHAQIIMDLQVRNLADFDITIVKQKFDVFFNGHLVANIVGREKIKLIAHTAVNVPLDIKFSPNEIVTSPAELFNIVVNWKQNKIRTVGKLTAKTSFIFLPKIPIDFTYTIAELMEPSTTDYCK